MKPVLFWGMVLACSLPVPAQETVTWLTIDMEPLYIHSGPRKGQGALDQLQQFFNQKIPEYRYQEDQVNIKRIVAAGAGGDNIATLILLETPERAKSLLFSRPYSISTPPYLIARKGDRDRFRAYLDGQGRVEFAKLVQDAKVRLGTVGGRSYTVNIDRVLREAPDRSHLDEASTLNANETNLGKLALGRVDAILEAVVLVDYYKLIKNPSFEFDAYPIAGEPEYRYLCVAVAKTPWGETMVTKVNRILDQVVGDEDYFRTIFSWSSDLDRDRALFRKAMKEWEAARPPTGGG